MFLDVCRKQRIRDDVECCGVIDDNQDISGTPKYGLLFHVNLILNSEVR